MINPIFKLRRVQITPKVYSNFPESPGVYIYIRSGKPIYVGKAINLKKRVSSYFRLELETKTRRMMNEAEEISYIRVDSEFEALLLEAKLIRYYMPKYNVVSKDDKHPLYIVITKEEFPIVKIIRKPDINKFPNIAIYGPFPSSTNVKSVLGMLRKIFPYSDHKIGKKPCLYSQIGLCNPCPNVITGIKNYELRMRETGKYKNNIKHIKAILDGKINFVVMKLKKEMNMYSSEQNYEDAMKIRDRIKKLEYITSVKTPADLYLENPNLFEDIRKREIDELKKIINTYGQNIHKLRRIECYDIAHLHGQNATASMVTFSDGIPDKNFYRHFKIYQKKGNDDYASMKEVARRRKKHLNDWGIPDLIIVDGGKGQLSVFLREFYGNNIPIIGLAKRLETLVIPLFIGETISFKELVLKNGPSLHLVERLRDEAHRFARAYHHKLFKRSLFEN